MREALPAREPPSEGSGVTGTQSPCEPKGRAPGLTPHIQGPHIMLVASCSPSGTPNSTVTPAPRTSQCCAACELDPALHRNVTPGPRERPEPVLMMLELKGAGQWPEYWGS